MPASGLKLTAEHGIEQIQVNQLDLPFRAYTFTLRAQPVYVFFCVWEDQPLTGSPDLQRQRTTSANRIRAVLEGRRHLGQQVLQVMITGAGDLDAARTQLAAGLQKLIRAAPAKS